MTQTVVWCRKVGDSEGQKVKMRKGEGEISDRKAYS